MKDGQPRETQRCAGFGSWSANFVESQGWLQLGGCEDATGEAGACFGD